METCGARHTIKCVNDSIFHMNKYKKVLIAAFTCAISVSASANSVMITAEEYGDAWPFTVSEGQLHCKNNAVGFLVEGVDYGLNGTATSAGLAPIEPIWKFDMEKIEEMAELFETTVEAMIEEAPLRINIGAVISDGLKLCNS